MFRRLMFILMVLILSSGVIAREIKYLDMNGIGEDIIGFAVLKLVLDKVDKEYQLSIDSRVVSRARATIMIESGQLDVADFSSSRELDGKLEPIYLPLEMGLLGWRVFIIREDMAEVLTSVRTTEDLKSFTFGQGQWVDVGILENSGFTVVTTSKLNTLFKMLQGKRFDLLPLGGNEAHRLMNRFGDKNAKLMVDKSIVLIYPFGRFFYVRKNDDELIQDITTGMERALSDGSLLSLLKTHPFSRDIFEQLHLNERIQIRIENPYLTEGFKAINPKWWYSP